MTTATEQPTAQTADITPTVSVVICAYSSERREMLREGVAALARQTLAPLETIVVIDGNPDLLTWGREQLGGARVVANAGERGSSEAKNTAIGHARGEVVAFLDDDAVPGECWLEQMVAPYRDPAVFGTSGSPTPRWQLEEAPDWLPVEFYWTIGCGYRGLPTRIVPIRNPIGASMSFRRAVFERTGGFKAHLGPNMTTPGAHGGGEETELGIRAGRVFPDGKLMHVPNAPVEHQVPADRATFRYFRRRCWLEGRAKALLSGMVGTSDGLASERAYTLKTLPTGVLRGLADAGRGDLAGLRRAAAIIAGLTFTTAGYAWGRLAIGIVGVRKPRGR